MEPLGTGLTPMDDGLLPDAVEKPSKAGLTPMIDGPDGRLVPLSQFLADRFGEMYQASRTAFDEADLHRAFYDGDQWDSRVMRSLWDAGRPATVYNVVGKAVDNISGRERGMKLKPKLLPRHADAQLLADGLTRAMEWLREATKAPRALSASFKNALLGPMGWVSIEYDDSNPTMQPHRIEAIDPRFVLVDQAWVSDNPADMADMCRLRMVSLPRALKAYPDQAAALRAAVGTASEVEGSSGTANGGVPIGGDYGNVDGLYTTTWAPFGGSWGPLRRGWLDPFTNMVMLREHWWWEEREGQFAVLPDGTSWELREDDPELYQAAQMALNKGAVVRPGRVRDYFWAVCAGPVVLDWGPSPYWHRQMPYVPVVAFRDRFGLPYGIIRRMVWPQRELNASHSRMTSSARSRWAIARKGALTPADKARLERQLGWDNFLVEVDDPSGLQIGTDKGDVPMWANIQQDALAYLNESVGQNEANYGDTSNEQSGAAIEARASQAAQNQGELFDNLRYAHGLVYELALSNFLQFGNRDQYARILSLQAAQNMGDKFDQVAFGRAMGEAVISTLRFDLVMTDQVESGTQQQTRFRQASELLAMMPDQVRAALAPDLVRMSDFPDAEGMALKVEQALNPMMAPGMAPPGPMGPADTLPGLEVEAMQPEGIPPEGMEVAA